MRVRFRYAKVGKIRFTSQRDVARMWERALRRVGVPLAWSAGFNPRPLLSFGLALPTGCESEAEYLDCELDGALDGAFLAALPGRLEGALPEGLSVTAGAVVDDGAPSLQSDVTTCGWKICVPGLGVRALGTLVDNALGASSLPVRRERKGRVVDDDLRPSIVVLRVAPAVGGAAVLEAELRTQPRGVRPVELARALGTELGLARRTHQWIERDGSRWEPLPAAAVPTAARERAS